jgi:hypothetical protein
VAGNSRLAPSCTGVIVITGSDNPNARTIEPHLTA